MSVLSVSVLGRTLRAGAWRVRAAHVSLCYLGQVRLDLRDAVFTSARRRGIVYAVALLGGVEVVVPPGMGVSVSGLGVVGTVQRLRARAAPGEPTVRVVGIALWSAITVRQEPRELG